jgi:hypothetical protein
LKDKHTIAFNTLSEDLFRFPMEMTEFMFLLLYTTYALDLELAGQSPRRSVEDLPHWQRALMMVLK